jgi:hypothetical protein
MNFKNLSYSLSSSSLMELILDLQASSLNCYCKLALAITLSDDLCVSLPN